MKISGKLSHCHCFLKWILRTEPAVGSIILFVSSKALYQSCGMPRGSREQNLGIQGGYEGRGNKKQRGSFGGQMRGYLSLPQNSLLLMLRECDAYLCFAVPCCSTISSRCTAHFPFCWVVADGFTCKDFWELPRLNLYMDHMFKNITFPFNFVQEIPSV